MQNQTVWAHDGTLSPNLSVPKLKELIETAVNTPQDLFATSYVISHDKKEVYITSHCLLSNVSHEILFKILDDFEGLTLEDLSHRESPIQKQLQDFQTGATVRPEHIASLFARPKVCQSEIAKIIATYQSQTWYGKFLSIFGIKHMSKTMVILSNYVSAKNPSEEIKLDELESEINKETNDDGRKRHRVGLFNNSEASDNSGTDSIIEQIKGLYRPK